MGLLFFGPLLAKIICDPNQKGEAFGIIIFNLIAVAIWTAIIMAVWKEVAYWPLMFFTWIGFFTIQGFFFWMAIEGTKCGDFVKSLFTKEDRGKN